MSKKVHLQIDGRDIEAAEGMTVLEAAQSAGIEIPTLCFHHELEPMGGCRLCMVELDFGDWTRLVVSCVYLVDEGLVVRTRSPKVDKIRKGILELQLAHAPESPQLTALAEEYGADRNRFEPEALAAALSRAEGIARCQGEFEHPVTLAEPSPIPVLETFFDATASIGPRERAESVRPVLESAASSGFTATVTNFLLPKWSSSRSKTV